MSHTNRHVNVNQNTKKGKGVFYGRKRDAKLTDNVSRRRVDRRIAEGDYGECGECGEYDEHEDN